MTKGKSAIQKGGRTSQSPPSALDALLPTDFLFCLLALDQKEGAIGIGLSGAGSGGDGSMGVGALTGGSK